MSIVGQRIRMTASEIAMGRYMRAPDHQTADFDTAFAEFASPDDKKPSDTGAAGATGGDAAAGGEGDGAGAGAASGDGSGGAAGDSGDGAGAAGAGGEGAAAAGAEAGAADADGAAGKAGKGKAGDGAGADAGAASGADAGAGAAGDAAAGADAGAAPDKPGDAAGAAGADAAAGAAAAGAPDADAILAGLKKLVGQTETPAAGAEAAAAAETPKPVYTDEEQTFLTQYEKDWGDVVKGEALKRRAEYQALLGHVFTQIANFVKPIQETTEALAQRTFTADVRSAVPDYSDQLRADVETWVKSQPAYLQVAYNHVIEEGTVDEVKDLVDRYRTATGKPAPKPAGAGGAAPKPGDKGNELSDEAKKAAAALAPVDSKRSGVSAPSDPANFEDAWKQAAADLG